MDFNAQVHVFACSLAHAPNVLDCVIHLLHVRLEVRLALVIVMKRVDVSNRVETLRLFALDFPDGAINVLFVHVRVNPGAGTHCAAEQLVSGNAQCFALDVPECDVDG